MKILRIISGLLASLSVACSSVVAPTTAVHGVVRVEGKALPGTRVFVSSPQGAELASTTTNSEGTFELTGIPVRTELVISSELEGTRAQPLNLPPLKPSENRYVVLQPSLRGVAIVDCTVTTNERLYASFSGQILSMTGSTLGGAKVTLSSDEIRRTYRTGSDGAFRFDELPFGQYLLTVARHGYISRTLQAYSSICERHEVLEIHLVRK